MWWRPLQWFWTVNRDLIKSNYFSGLHLSWAMLLQDNESRRQQSCHTDVMAGQTEGQREEHNRGSTSCAISPLRRQRAPSLLPASTDSLFLKGHRCNTSRHIRFCRLHIHAHNYLTFLEMTSHYAPSYAFLLIQLYSEPSQACVLLSMRSSFRILQKPENELCICSALMFNKCCTAEIAADLLS